VPDECRGGVTFDVDGTLAAERAGIPCLGMLSGGIAAEQLQGAGLDASPIGRLARESIGESP
jgi:hypothetical protein